MFFIVLFLSVGSFDCQLDNTNCGLSNSTYLYCSENHFCLQEVCGTGIEFSASPETDIRFSNGHCIPNWLEEYTQHIERTCGSSVNIILAEVNDVDSCGINCLIESTCVSFVFDPISQTCTHTTNCEEDLLVFSPSSDVYIRKQSIEVEICDITTLVSQLAANDVVCAPIINFGFVDSDDITEAEMCECFLSDDFQPASDFDCMLNHEKERWISTTAEHCQLSECTGLGYKRLAGGQMQCPEVSSSTFQPLIDCASSCSNQTACIGFSYNSLSQQCHKCLSTSYSISSELHTSTYLSFYYKDQSCSCNTILIRILGTWTGFVLRDYTQENHMVWVRSDGSQLYSAMIGGSRRWLISDASSGHVFMTNQTLAEEDTLPPESTTWLLFQDGDPFQPPLAVDGIIWECSEGFPTISPTFSAPTNVPSSIPTKVPSNNPTTSNPTNIPTPQPTNAPTSSTTTTRSPTKDPTTPNPTLVPSTSTPSNDPTKSDGSLGITDPSITSEPSKRPTAGSGSDGSSSSSNNDGNDIESQLLFLVLILITALCLICVLFLVFLTNQRRDVEIIHKEKEYRLPADIEMTKLVLHSEEIDSAAVDPSDMLSDSDPTAVTILHANEFAVTFEDQDLGIGLSTVNFRGEKEVIVSDRSTLHAMNHIQHSSIVKRVNNLDLTNMSAEQISQIFSNLRRRPLKIVFGYPRPKDKYSTVKEESSSSEKLEKAAAQRVDIYPYGGADMNDADVTSILDYPGGPIPTPPQQMIHIVAESKSSKRRRKASLSSQASSHIFRGAPIIPKIPFLPSEPDVREEGEMYDITFYDDIGLELIPAFLSPSPRGAKVIGRYSEIARSKVLENSIIHSVNNLRVGNLDHKVVLQMISNCPRPVQITFIQPKHVRRSMTPPLVADDISEHDLISDGSQFIIPAVPVETVEADPNVYDVSFYNDDVGFTIYTQTGFGALVGELETQFAAERIVPDSILVSVNNLMVEKLSFEEIKHILITAELPLQISFKKPTKRFPKRSYMTANDQSPPISSFQLSQTIQHSRPISQNFHTPYFQSTPPQLSSYDFYPTPPSGPPPTREDYGGGPVDQIDMNPRFYEATFDQPIIGVEILPNPHGSGVVVGQLTTPTADRLVISGSQIARVNDENVMSRNAKEVISIIRSAPRPLTISFIRPETFGAASFTQKNAPQHGQAVITFTESDLQLDLIPGEDGIGALVGGVDEDGPKFILNHLVYRIGSVDVVDISFNQIQKLIRKLNRPFDVVFQDPVFYFPKTEVFEHS